MMSRFWITSREIRNVDYTAARRSYHSSVDISLLYLELFEKTLDFAHYTSFTRYGTILVLEKIFFEPINFTQKDLSRLGYAVTKPSKVK